MDIPADEKASYLKRFVRSSGERAFTVEPNTFSQVPGSPFAYWVSDDLRSMFSKLPAFESGERTAKVGVQTSDDFRFVRTWWEVPETARTDRWLPFMKSGAASAFYADINMVLNYAEDGREIKTFAESTPGTTHWSRNIRSTEYYLKPGLTWALRTKKFAASIVPEGCIFSVSRYQAFVPDQQLLAVVGRLNSSICTALLRMCSERFEHPKFIIGIVQRLPFPPLDTQSIDTLSTLVKRAWSLKRTLASTRETSHAFLLPSPLLDEFDISEISSEIEAIEAELEKLAFQAYGVSENDQVAISKWTQVASDNGEREDDEEESEDSDEIESDSIALPDSDSILSWAVGVAFGRFDIRLTTGAREIPAEPDPTAPLPITSPGMLPHDCQPFNGNGGILVDDVGHLDDIVKGVSTVLDAVDASAPDSDEIRQVLARDFFATHIQLYSAGRRKAPVYWQLATSSARYSVWLYIHKFSRDTLFRVQNDYVAAKLSHEQRQLEVLRSESGSIISGAQRKAIEEQQHFIEEIQAFYDEIKRVAPLWNPNLNDGVIVNFAPLWRLVPHNRSWQKALKATWDALQRGAYDWTHMAMHLWPERVVPKCAEDRSLAIAHNLEDVFWFEDESGKWKRRSTPIRQISDLVRERTSDAVKAALGELLNASEPTGTVRRPRRRA
jgi:hypothetical protein